MPSYHGGGVIYKKKMKAGECGAGRAQVGQHGGAVVARSLWEMVEFARLVASMAPSCPDHA